MLASAKNRLFEKSRTRIYLREDDTIETVYGQDIKAFHDFITCNGKNYFTVTSQRNEHSLYEFSGLLTEIDDRRILGMACFDNKLWISANGQVLIVESVGGTLDPGISFPFDRNSIRLLAQAQGHLWLASRDYVYRRPQSINSGFEPIAARLPPFSETTKKEFIPSRFWKSENAFWLLGHNGIYKLHEDVEIDIDLNFRERGEVNSVIGNQVKINNIDYKKAIGTPVSPAIPPKFTVFATSDREVFSRDKFRSDRYSNWEEFNFTLDDESSAFFVAVKDSYGNYRFEVFDNVFTAEKPPPAMRLLLLNIVIGVILTYFLSAVLAAIWSIFLVFIVSFFRTDHSRKLRDVANGLHLVRTVPIVNSASTLVFSLVENAANRRLVRTYKDVLAGREDCTSELANLLAGRDLCAGNNSPVFVDDVPAEDLAVSAARSNWGRIANHLPIAMSCEADNDLSQEEIKNRFIVYLRRAILDSTVEFCEDLLLRSSFIFICALNKRDNSTLARLLSFAREYGKGDSCLIVSFVNKLPAGSAANAAHPSAAGAGDGPPKRA